MPTCKVEFHPGLGSATGRLATFRRANRYQLAIKAAQQLPGWLIPVLAELHPSSSQKPFSLTEGLVFCDIQAYSPGVVNGSDLKLLLGVPMMYLREGGDVKIEQAIKPKFHAWYNELPEQPRESAWGTSPIVLEVEVVPDLTSGIVWMSDNPDVDVISWSDLDGLT